MTRYNHACDIAFEVVSNSPDGIDFTAAMLKAALLQRIKNLDESEEWLEAVGAPFESYEEDEHDPSFTLKTSTL